jgi:hypothetical protein
MKGRPLKAMNLEMIKWLGYAAKLCCCVWLIGYPAVADGADTTNRSRIVDENKQNQDELKSLRQEAARLKEQNQQLRIENQKLRRLLADQGEATSSGPLAARDTVSDAARSLPTVVVNTNPVAPAADIALTHWLTKSSSKRHNTRCKFYQKTEGRLCGPNEGLPCTVCGG